MDCTFYLCAVLKYNFEVLLLYYFNYLLIDTSIPVILEYIVLFTPQHLFDNFSSQLLCKFRLFSGDWLVMYNQLDKRIFKLMYLIGNWTKKTTPILIIGKEFSKLLPTVLVICGISYRVLCSGPRVLGDFNIPVKCLETIHRDC